jgi:hypothetical protein
MEMLVSSSQEVVIGNGHVYSLRLLLGYLKFKTIFKIYRKFGCLEQETVLGLRYVLRVV